MAKLNFKTTSRGRELKGVPPKYSESKGRPNISMSDGIRPAFPMLPYGYLPVGFEDITTNDNVVIPKGRIVSAITSNDSLGDGSDYYGVPRGIMGLMVPCNNSNVRDIGGQYDNQTDCESAGGTWDVDTCTLDLPANMPIGVVEHDVYQDIRGVNLNYDMRNKNWGVLTRQLMKIPAVDTYNFDLFLGEAGGFVAAASGVEGTSENQAGTYSATIDIAGATGAPVDLYFATYSAAYTGATYASVDSITAGGTALVLGTDYTNTDGAIQFILGNAEDAIVVSFTYDIANAGSGAPTSSAALSGSGYEAVEKKYTFYTYNSEATEGNAGDLLKSDFYGNFMPSSGSRKAASAVGYLMGVDFRFEKDLLDTVQSKYEADANFRVAGTGTMGVPQFLYNFAYEALNAGLTKVGTTWSAKFGDDEAKVIKNAVDQGVFGEAWVQLDI